MKFSEKEEKWLSDLQTPGLGERIRWACFYAFVLFTYTNVSFWSLCYPLADGTYVLTSKSLGEAMVVLLFLHFLFRTLCTSSEDKLIVALANRIKEMPDTEILNKNDSANS